jgi:hypothetical protein
MDIKILLGKLHNKVQNYIKLYTLIQTHCQYWDNRILYATYITGPLVAIAAVVSDIDWRIKLIYGFFMGISTFITYLREKIAYRERMTQCQIYNINFERILSEIQQLMAISEMKPMDDIFTEYTRINTGFNGILNSRKEIIEEWAIDEFYQKYSTTAIDELPGILPKEKIEIPVLIRTKTTDEKTKAMDNILSIATDS